MAKAPKKQKPKDFEKDYDKVMKKYQKPAYQAQQQWSTPGDFFVKFSLYKESSSGTSSSNTTFVSQ
jgi:hypothetical protein